MRCTSCQPIDECARGNRIFLARQKRTQLRHAVCKKCLTNGFPAPDFKSNFHLLQTGNMGYKSAERKEISEESIIVCKL